MKACVALAALCLSCVTLMSSPAPAQADQNAVTLVRDGKPVASIVIAKDADKVARFAATDLQYHIELITGATLPIVTDDKPVRGTRVMVGASRATRALDIDPSIFDNPQVGLVKFVDNGIVIIGRDKPDKGRLVFEPARAHGYRTWPGFWDDQGTMYATYDFLRQYCNVRWLNPTDLGTTYPRKDTLTVGGDQLKREPFMDYRGGSAVYPLAERIQSGGGGWSPNSPKGKQYNRLAFGSDEAEVIRAKCRLFMHRMKAGGQKSPCNHSLRHYYERFWHKDHKNFEAYHPEYFAQGYDGEEPPQLCYSNPEVIKQVVKDIRRYFDHGGHKKPMRQIAKPGYTWGKDFYSLEPDDNSAFCKCDKCTPQYELDKPRYEQHSKYWFTFVNAVARQIKKSHPDKRITVLAYMTHEGIPDFQLEDNVSVFFCISQNRTPYNVSELKRQIDLTRQWKKQQGLPMYLWLYHCFPKFNSDRGKFHHFPGFFAHELGRQFKIYEELDVRGIFHCGLTDEVENWLSYRLMDNPSLDIDAMLETYFAQFGDAAPYLRQFYEVVEQRYCDPESYPITQKGTRFGGHQNVTIAWQHLGNAETMKKLENLMEKARAAAADDDLSRKRVELWDIAVWQYMKAGRDSYVERMEAPMPDINAPRVAKAGGDPSKVDWNEAASLGGKWYKRGDDTPSDFKRSGRIGHDGEYVYLELVEPAGLDQLVVSPQIACFDDWEIFVARQRALPYRQYLVGPTGLHKALSNGEVNWRSRVPATEYTDKFFGGNVKCTTDDKQWVTRMAFPLKSLTEKPLSPGDSFYMNVVRVRNGKLAGEPQFGIDTWVSHTTVHTVDRLGKVTLAK